MGYTMIKLKTSTGIIEQAEREIFEEKHREAVDKEKDKIRSRRKIGYWIPKIKIEWRGNNYGF